MREDNGMIYLYEALELRAKTRTGSPVGKAA